MSDATVLFANSARLLRPFAAAVAFLALAACSGEPKDTIASIPGVIELSPAFTGDYALIDTNGEPVADETFHGAVPIIYFGFASCPDVCPLALGRLTAALNLLDDKTLAEIRPIFITVDPKRDTPEKLSVFLGFDDRLIGLTGDPAAIDAARLGYKVYAAEEPLEDSQLGYTVNHTSLFYIADRQGEPRIALKDTMTPEQIATVLKAAVEW